MMEKLAPFMLRARAIEVGRDRLAQIRKRLAFVVLTSDISENSRDAMLQLFPCPVYQCMSSADVERLFGFRNTKVLGFRRSPLANSVLPELASFRIQLASGAVRQEAPVTGDK